MIGHNSFPHGLETNMGSFHSNVYMQGCQTFMWWQINSVNMNPLGSTNNSFYFYNLNLFNYNDITNDALLHS